MKTIAIIGAGLSGTLLTMNLLNRSSQTPVRIVWIDRNDETNMGPAYSTNEDYLLNVPAELMGAFSADPEHFLKWAQSRVPDAGKGSYLPRKLYREYIRSLLQKALKVRHKNKFLERIREEVTDIEVNDNKLKIITLKNREFAADQVVLALGNALPEDLPLDDMSYIKDKRYIRDPWDPSLLDRISPHDTVFFIGTGQTMADLITGLFRRKHKGRIIAISRKGLLPLSQKMTETYPSFYNELKGLSSVVSIFGIVRKHIRMAEQQGRDVRSVIDALRPHTTAIWTALPAAEKKRFLRHLFRYWEIIRSRIPPESEKIVNEMRSSGQLGILAGRMTKIEPREDAMQIFYRERFTSQEKITGANILVNCRGPNLDYEKIDQPLIRNLINKKMICCDPAHIGINANVDGAILAEDGTPSRVIHTIGPTLKGIVWESIATPEIRVYAENLSRMLLREEMMP